MARDLCNRSSRRCSTSADALQGRPLAPQAKAVCETRFGTRTLAAIVFLLIGLFGSANVVGAIHGTVLFSATATLTASLSNPVSLAVADIDGNGWSDLVASANNPEQIVWYRNNGDGTYASVRYIVTTSPSTTAFSNVTVSDINGDGKPDVVFWSGSSIKWTPNLGGSDPVAQFGYIAPLPGQLPTNQLSVATTNTPETVVGTADLNNDNRFDVLSITISEGTLIDNSVAWVPNLAGGFGSRTVISTAGGYPSSVQGVDLDKDGWKDLLVTTESDHAVAWFRNLGGGNFGTAPGHRRVISNTVTVARAAAVGDLNGDGWPDVVTAGSGTGTIRWHAHNGSVANPAFGLALTVTQGASVPWALAVRDMNSDGWLDVIVAAAGGNKVVWCENLGGGNFGAATTNQRTIASLNLPTSIEVVDYDQDGTFDLFANANSGGVVRVFRNLGGQTAIATANTAPGALIEGRRDAALKFAVSNRGFAGDSAAKLDTLSLRLEGPLGALSTAQANALIDKVAVHVDADSSGAFDPANDPAVATVTQLTLTNGVLSLPFTGGLAAALEVAAGATRTYFVVLKIAESAAVQNPNSVRVIHLSHGSGRSIMRDATSNAALTIESASIANAPSGFISAQAAHTYTDYAYLYFDSATATGTAATEDFDFDGSSNLVEFGFGMDPADAGSMGISVSGATLLQRGLPIARATNTGTGVTYEAIFGRRKDTLAGLTYAVQFSANLSTWVTSTATPMVLADDGVIEAVAVPYPFFVSGKKARFFRVVVTSP